jgi:hypothetical protein
MMGRKGLMRMVAMLLPGLALALPLAAQGNAGAQKENPAASAKELEVIRVIEDPATGEHWTLVRDPQNPAAPGRLLRQADWEAARKCGDGAGQCARFLKPRQLIHAGDKVLVEEHTDRVDAVLEAVAVNSAAYGAPLDVRLRSGGKLIRVYVSGPGKASLQPVSGERP